MTIPAGLHLTPIDGEHAEPDPIDAFKKLRAQAHAAATSSTDADPIAEFKALRAQALSASLSKAATSESTRALPDDRERRAKDAATPNLLSTGLLREAEQGATFAFGDELNAAVRAIGKEKYSEALAKERAALHEYEDAHPVATLGAQITGGLAGGAGLGAAAKAIGIGAKAASAVPLTSRFGKLWQATKTAGTAAAAGGVAAAGTAEGDLEDRAKAIPMGAAFGVGTAAGLKLGGRVAGKLIPRPASSTSALGQAADRVGLSSHDELAKGDLLSQIKRARMSLPDVERAAAAAPESAMLMDVAGQPMLRRAEGAATVPSSGSALIESKLRERVAEQPARVQRTVASAMTGGPRENAVLSARQLIDARKAAAGPLYDAAYAAPDITDPDIHGLFKHSQFRDAYTEAQRLAMLEDKPLPPLFKTSDVGGVEVHEQVPIPVRSLDYMKRGLDAMIEKRAGGASAISRSEARLLRGKLNEALAAADAEVPAYGAARAKFAGDSQLADAHERGQQFLKESHDEIAADWPKMTDGERELYRRGALSALSEKLSSVTDGRDVTRILQNPLMRSKLETILPDHTSAVTFLKQLRDETALHQNAQTVLSGSPTARRMAQQADDGSMHAIGSIGTAVAGGPLSVIKSALKEATNRSRGLTESHVDALAPYLTTSGPALQRLIRELESTAARQGKSAARSGRFVRAAAQVAGGRLGPGEP